MRTRCAMSRVRLYPAQRSVELMDPVISTVILVYDAILQLPREIKYIWNARWSPAKAVYLLNRYLSIVALCLLVHGNSLACFFVAVATDTHEGTAMLDWGVITDAVSTGITWCTEL